MWHLEDSRIVKVFVVLCAAAVGAFCGWLLFAWAPGLTVSSGDRPLGTTQRPGDASVSPSPTGAASSDTPDPGAPGVAVLGDSFTSGAAAQKPAEGTWPEQLCQMGTCEYHDRFAEPGSGFVARGAAGTRFGERVDAVVAARPDVVVVAGGAYDKGAPAAVFERRVADVLERLQVGLPQSRVVVLSPFWRATPLPPEVQELREIVRAAARAEGLDFVDVAELLGSSGAGLVTEAGLPTPAGHAMIADAVGQAVRDNLAQVG